jgi:hypothetical protein
MLLYKEVEDNVAEEAMKKRIETKKELVNIKEEEGVPTNLKKIVELYKKDKKIFKKITR